MIIFLLLLLGLYFPTSQNAMISSEYLMINSIILFLLLIFLIFKGVKVFKIPFFIGMGSIFLLLISTMTTPFNEIRYGSGAYFLCLSLLFCLDFKSIEFGKRTEFLITTVNVINVIIGIGIITQNAVISEFIINNYSAFYELLVPNMISFRKPVLTFATHSLAGFFIYLFFFLNFTKFKNQKKKIYLFFSLCYLVFLVFLSSSASLLFFTISLTQILIAMFKMKKKNFAILLLIASIAIIAFYNQITNYLIFVKLQVEGEMHRTNGGLIGRYSENGNLQVNIDYLMENFFRPIGFGYSKQIILADSGMLEYLIRGTFLLVILIYLGLFIFLRNNLRSKRTSTFLFLIILLFELGFTSLTYFRMIYILPFIVVYMNTTQYKSRPSLS